MAREIRLPNHRSPTGVGRDRLSEIAPGQETATDLYGAGGTWPA